MIDNILSTLKNELNTYLKNQLGHEYEYPVTICSLTEDGKEDSQATLTFLYLKQENSLSTLGSTSQNRPLQLTVFVLLSFPTATNYKTSLQVQSMVLRYFQLNPIMTPQHHQELNPSIGKLSFELENLSLSDISQLWSMFGQKHRPALVYKIRTLFVEDQGGSETSWIKGVSF